LLPVRDFSGRAAVDVEQAQRSAEAEVAGILQKIEAEKQRIAMLRAQYQAEIITPADAQKEGQILAAQAEAAAMRGKVEAELKQLERTISILRSAGKDGLKAYVIEKFEEMIGSFAGTMDLFPVDHVTVVSGGASQGPISAIHPNALDVERTRQIQMALAGAAQAADRGATTESTPGAAGKPSTR